MLTICVEFKGELMKKILIKSSKVFLYLAKLGAILYIINSIFVFFKPDLNAIELPKSFMIASLIFSIIQAVLYYLIADKVIKVIENSEKNPFTMENRSRFTKIGGYLLILSVMNYISNHSNVLRADLEKTNSVGVVFIGGVMCFVISNMIYKAVKIKKDNELTI